MPGYILHLTEGEIILGELKENGADFSENPYWMNAFRCGCLLPDAAPKEEKGKSHFWNLQKTEEKIVLPDLLCFLEEHGAKLRDIKNHPKLCGYYAHLLLDRWFIDFYLKSCTQLLNHQGDVVSHYSETEIVRLKQTGKEISLRQLFSKDYLYEDYSRLNIYFLNKYKIAVPTDDLSDDEMPCNEWKLSSLLKNLDVFLKESSTYTGEALEVLELHSLEAFLEKAAKETIQSWRKLR